MARVFVTGATGVLGRGTVERLLAQGHEVRALARDAERASVIAAMGAAPVVADIYDLDAMTGAVSGTDALLHLATRIPPVTKARKPSAWIENTKLRAVGTKVLVDAALAAGVHRVVAESITFIYRDGGSAWLDERAPVDAGVGLQSVVTLEDEVARFAASAPGDGVGISLRFGAFYGADARGTDEFLTNAARRVAPAIGSPEAYISSIETGDAARAVVASFAAPSGVYNVVDDEPLARREYVDAFERAFGFRRLRFIPQTVVKVVGGATAQVVMRSQRVSNAAFRTATGWAPAIPSAVEGWAAVAATRSEASHA
jgi:nucleoside-diphosphate-sugar epimerase